MGFPMVVILVAVAVLLSVVATWKVRGSIGLTPTQKTVQTVLAWVIPFIGAIAVIVVSTDPAEREKRREAGDPGADALSGGAFFGGDGGAHHDGHGHGHGHGGDAGHGGDGGGHGGDGGGGH